MKHILLALLIPFISISGNALAENCGNPGDTDYDCSAYNSRKRAEREQKKQREHKSTLNKEGSYGRYGQKDSSSTNSIDNRGRTADR